MPDNDLQISIGADVGALVQGAGQAQSSIKQLVDQVQSIGKLFGSLGDDVKKAIDGFKQVQQAISELSKGASDLGKVSTAVRDLGQAASTAEGSAPASLRAVGSALTELGRGVGGLGTQAASGLRGATTAISSFLGRLGGGQIPGVSSALRGLGDAVASVGTRAASGLEGASGAASRMLTGLGAAAADGGVEVAALGAAATGVGAVVMAVGAAAITAGSALASWAAQTRDSAAASATARQHAAELDDAMHNAGDAFGHVATTLQTALQQMIDSIASAFAPAMTTIVNATTDLANAFQQSYDSGGLAKTIIDGLVGAVSSLASALSGVISFWQLEIQLAGDAAKVWSDFFGVANAGANDLKDAFNNALAPAVKDFETAATLAWNTLGGAFDALVGVVKRGFQDWLNQNPMVVGAINGIAAAFNWVEGQVKSVLDSINGWIAGVAKSLMELLNQIPGVGAALRKTAQDLKGFGQDGANGALAIVGSASAAAQPNGSASASGGVNLGARSGSGAPSNSGSGGASGGHSNNASAAPDCGCDPQTAADNAAQAGNAINEEQEKRAKTGVAINEAANAAIEASDGGVTVALNTQLGVQVDASRAAYLAQVQISDETTQHIADNNKKALEDFKRSLDQTVSAFTKGMLQMAEGTKSFGQVMRNIGQQMLNDLLRVVDQQVDSWAWGVTERVLASSQGQSLLQALGLKDLAQQVLVDARKVTSAGTTAQAQQAAAAAARSEGMASDTAFVQAQKLMNAQAAFSGAIAAIAPIPLVGPFEAPEIAAEMAALASAAGGFDIPSGVNPLTQLHAQEMVLPARLANPMRAMLAGFGRDAQPASPWSQAAGDTHHHTWNVQTLDGASLYNTITGNASDFGRAMDSVVRGRNGRGFGYAG